MARQITLSSYFKKTEINEGILQSALNLPKAENDETAEANASVLKSLASEKGRKKRGPYIQLSPTTKADIGRYASQNGTMVAVRHFEKKGINISESTARYYKKHYVSQLRNCDDGTVTEIISKARGRPLMLGMLDGRVQNYIKALRSHGGIVNRTIVMSAAKGIVNFHDSTLLAENGGPVNISNAWAESILKRMNMVKKKGTKAARHIPENFTQLKEEFFAGLRSEISNGSIPDDLIINIDQTGIKMVPCSEWTLDVQGSKQVPITALGDKREITALVGVTMSGKLISTQLIYAGKTNRCHPLVNFPPGWNITHSESHWSTESTMLEYVQKVLTPYITSIRRILNLAVNHPALLILDVFAAHRTASFLEALANNNIKVRFVPGGCTGELQPLDVAINDSLKKKLKSKFSDFYAQKVQNALQNGESIENVAIDLKTATMKIQNARWIISTLRDIAGNKDLIKSAFQRSGITAAVQDVIPITERPAEHEHRAGIFDILMTKNN